MNSQAKYNLEKDPNWYMKRMRFAGKFIYFLGAAKFYYNGDTLGYVWRWWHPLSWLLLPVFFVISVLIVGFPETVKYKHDLGIDIAPFFKQNPEQLEWLK